MKFNKTSRVIIILSMVFVAVFSMGFTMNRIPQVNSVDIVPDESPVAINTNIPNNEIISTYITDDGLSRAILLENNRFYVEGRPEISYTPTGSYEIDGDKLFLNVSENQQFIFSIHGNSLIFESGEWLENWVAKETVFVLEEINVDLQPMIYVNSTLYRISAQNTSYSQMTNEFIYIGEIKSSVHTTPNEEFQANDNILGAKVYQYNENIVVLIKDEYYLYERVMNDR